MVLSKYAARLGLLAGLVCIESRAMRARPGSTHTTCVCVCVCVHFAVLSFGAGVALQTAGRKAMATMTLDEMENKQTNKQQPFFFFFFSWLASKRRSDFEIQNDTAFQPFSSVSSTYGPCKSTCIERVVRAPACPACIRARNYPWWGCFVTLSGDSSISPI